MILLSPPYIRMPPNHEMISIREQEVLRPNNTLTKTARAASSMLVCIYRSPYLTWVAYVRRDMNFYVCVR